MINAMINDIVDNLRDFREYVFLKKIKSKFPFLLIHYPKITWFDKLFFKIIDLRIDIYKDFIDEYEFTYKLPFRKERKKL